MYIIYRPVFNNKAGRAIRRARLTDGGADSSNQILAAGLDEAAPSVGDNSSTSGSLLPASPEH